jgi:hypothetical protein
MLSTPFVEVLRTVLAHHGVASTAEAVGGGSPFELAGHTFTVQHGAGGALADAVVVHASMGPVPSAAPLDTYRLLLRCNTLAAAQGTPTFGLRWDSPDVVMMARLPAEAADAAGFDHALNTLQGMARMWRDTRGFTEVPDPAPAEARTI